MPKKLPKSIKEDEFKRLIAKLPKKYKNLRVAFLLSFEAGLRVSEVVNLREDNFNFNNNSIEILNGKGGKDRIVPLPKLWKGWMITQIPLTIGIRSLQRHFSNFSKAANLNKDYTFHSLRHGFATTLTEKGVPLNQVQLLMGHSNLATTSIYTRARPMDALKSYRDLF